MKVSKCINNLCLCVLLSAFVFGGTALGQSLKVFILAGQSNMVGHGKSEHGHGDVIGAIGSLRYMVNTDPDNYGHLVNGDGSWKTRSDVKVWWRDSDIGAPRAVLKGDLGIGFAQSRNSAWFGPEYAFGWAMGDHFGDPVLIIKTSWGGKSIEIDFRPPSAVAARGGEVGPYYLGMLEYVQDALDNLGTEFPEYANMDYQISGFGWHQGWNDLGSNEAKYEANMADFIKDVRTDLGVPNLPFFIATTGMAGGSGGAEYSQLELAQLEMANFTKYPEFEGNVAVADTTSYVRDVLESPSNFGYHWNHNGESHFLIGDAMGYGMIDILVDPNAPVVDAGNDKITWSGETVTMDPNVVELDGSDWTNLTYKWTADPDTGVLISNDEIAAPTVTITKATNNPSIVTLMLEVNNFGRTERGVMNTMQVDVYGTACKAAIGKGLASDNPTDFDGNCITNLADFSKLALEWLNSGVLAVPQKK